MSARHLRVIEQDADRVYIVARTHLVIPGRPYIVSECLGDALVSAPDGLELRSRTEMRREPALAEALRAWEDHDDSLGRRERRARQQLSRPAADIAERERSRAMHPSTIARNVDIRRAHRPDRLA